MIWKQNPERLQKNGQNSQKLAVEIWSKGFMEKHFKVLSAVMTNMFHQCSTMFQQNSSGL